MRLSRVGIGEDTLYILIIATIIIWHDLFYNNSRKQNPALFLLSNFYHMYLLQVLNTRAVWRFIDLLRMLALEENQYSWFRKATASFHGNFACLLHTEPWSLDMVDILQNGIFKFNFWMKTYEFRSKFHWSMLLRAWLHSPRVWVWYGVWL